jgi:hypothetical protein
MQNVQKENPRLHALTLKLNQGVNWNAFFYIIYKISFTALSLALYKNLTTHDYANWANLNSITYLILLWLDCGFRKSIPRFSPELAKNQRLLKRFTFGIVIYQFLLLLAALPIFTICAPKITTLLRLKFHDTLYLFGSSLLITEGLVAILRLLFHANFWNKQFNSLATIALTIEMGINFYLLCSGLPSHEILNAILLTKISLSGMMTLASIPLLSHLIKTTANDQCEDINVKILTHSFIKHSGIMWVNTNLKSLSERNFMTPLLTYIIGPAHANLFKVINETALLFHRTVLKTIGTTDTTFLAHIEAAPESKALLPSAFKKLASKIAALCIPLLGILGLLFFLTLYNQENTNFAFQAFLIITIGYLTETLLSPYERVLEVKKRYGFLMYAYTPYIIALILMLSTSLITYIGLIGSLLIIHGVRLVSSLITMHLAKTSYGLRYPYKFTLSIIRIWVIRLALTAPLIYYLIALPYKELIVKNTIKLFTLK